MNKVAIKLHGELGKIVGSSWNLAVQSVPEAIRAIEVLSKHKLYRFLLNDQNKEVEYKILVNGKVFRSDTKLTLDHPQHIFNSELCTVYHNDSLKSIDIVPVIQGADEILDIFTIILGVILVVVGAFFSPVGLGIPLVVAGLGLVAAGVINLLSTPPKFDDFREFEKSKNSYLFNGPYNTSEEGGPVPVGYGRLLVGSQTISASYDISYFSAEDLTEDSDIEGAGKSDPDFHFVFRSTLLAADSSSDNNTQYKNTPTNKYLIP